MTEADNGLGMQQSFTWANARTNQHGGASGSDWKDPFSCSTLQQQDGASTPYPCDMADDNGWSHIVLTNKTVTENSPTSANANAQTTGTWNYRYFLNQLTAKECSNCAVGMYWGNANSGDWADYYNGKFVGFGLSIVTNPDGSSIDYGYGATEGWGVYDTSQVTTCLDGGYCANSPMWDYANATSGQPTLELTYAPQDQDGTWHVLKEITMGYWVFCNTGTPPTVFGSWDGYLVAQPEPDNPLVSCDVNQNLIQTYRVDGTYNNYTLSSITASTVPYTQTVTNYDWYFFPTNQIVTGNDLTSTPTTTTTWTYLRHDGITTTGPAPTGTYIVDAVAQEQVQDGNTTVWQCTTTSFDGQPWATGASATLTKGLVTGSTSYANCANQTGASTKSTTYNANGDPTTTLDPDANAGITSHKASTGTCTGFTACTGYDGTFGTLPTTGTNALNQGTTTAFTTTPAFGYGQWPSSATDANGQTTTTTYDVLGRVTSTTSPGETASDTTTSLVYTNVCNATGPQAPCLEVDTTQRLDASTTVTKRDFYDGMGQHVESRGAAPGGQDVVQYALYDSEGRAYFQSQAYFVTAYTGAPGTAAYSVPDVTKLGTTTTYDGLGRVTIATDANGKTTNTYYSLVCGPTGTNSDQACYSSTTTIDPNSHKSLGYTDALGRGIYAQTYTGNSTSTYALYRTLKVQYDVLGDAISTLYADGTHQRTATYDGRKRETAFTDPDLSSYTLGYDANGNLTSSIDPRGTSGTVYLGYDGLNRSVWKSTHSDGSSPLATSTYDSTASGNQGIGRLTSETFASGPSQSVTGSYAYIYDARGQQTSWNMTLGSTSYPFTTSYNDAGQATSLTYPDGDVVTTNYGAQDWLSGVTEAKSGTTNTLLNTLSYTGANGASQMPSSASVDNGVYTWNLSYDLDLRLSETKATQVSNSTVLFDQSRTLDAVGNVTTTNTTVAAGTDNQAFCYDEQNRLVWAGSQGTPSCGTSLTPGTLNSGNARYTQTYAYDVLDRLTTGPLGSGYTYGDANHLDAVTSAPTYSASYDVAGSMTGRNGNVLGDDALRRLITWQNTATSPTQTASYAYNGSGERVQQVVTSGGATTTTSYIGTYEDVATTGGTTTTTKYYQLGKVGTAEAVNGTLYYQIADDLGSVSAMLTASGGVQATELYDPFGYVRYTNGAMPTSYGYTKMRQDPSGLNYDHARYYDAGVGQFVTADYVQGPNRYAYVGGNPETTTDPSGNCWLVCAVIAAVATAAVAAVVDVGVQEVQSVTSGKGLTTNLDWGQVGKVAVTAGVIAGAVVALGPLAGAAVDASSLGEGIATVGVAAAQGLATDSAIVTTAVGFATPSVVTGLLGAETTAGIIYGAVGALGVGAVDGSSPRQLIEGAITGGVCGAFAGPAVAVCPVIAEGVKKIVDHFTGGDSANTSSSSHQTAISTSSSANTNANTNRFSSSSNNGNYRRGGGGRLNAPIAF